MPDPIILTLLLLGILGYLLVGLTPFTFDFARSPHVHFGFNAPANNALNFLCFIPLGVLIASLSWVERPLVAAGVVCGMLSLLVESLQLFIPGRFSTFSDLLLNTGGAVAGAYLASEFW
jgi:VanZ family protein